jgi:hypothetical protein
MNLKLCWFCLERSRGSDELETLLVLFSKGEKRAQAHFTRLKEKHSRKLYNFIQC